MAASSGNPASQNPVTWGGDHVTTAWGDEADLIDLLEVRPVTTGVYESTTRPHDGRPVVEGSQMLGQAIVAAGHHTPGRRIVSAHLVFMRAAYANEPLRFHLETLSHGRTLTTLGIAVHQGERHCATGTLLLDVMAPDVLRHQAPAPDVAGPEASEPLDMGVSGRDIRVVDNAYTDDPAAPAGPPVIDAWVRFDQVPEGPALHAGLLAQFTGHMSIAAALRPYEGIGQSEAHRTLSTAVNAITLAIHADVRVDRWMLYHHLSSFAGDGMTHTACSVHDEDGRLLASFSVECMVRRFPGSTAPMDEQRAL